MITLQTKASCFLWFIGKQYSADQIVVAMKEMYHTQKTQDRFNLNMDIGQFEKHIRDRWSPEKDVLDIVIKEGGGDEKEKSFYRAYHKIHAILTNQYWNPNLWYSFDQNNLWCQPDYLFSSLSLYKEHSFCWFIDNKRKRQENTFTHNKVSISLIIGSRCKTSSDCQ